MDERRVVNKILSLIEDKVEFYDFFTEENIVFNKEEIVLILSNLRDEINDDFHD